MLDDVLDGAWLTGLRQRADLPPLRPRVEFRLAGHPSPIGSIEPALGQRAADAGLPLRPAALGWELLGPPDPSLATIARWLDDHDLGSTWRDELLDVHDATGTRVGAIERAAVRPLGLTTQAVHLLGHTEGGATWVQQRAFDKPSDPGLWDTTMGGLIAAGESVADSLRRETFEEAGLHIGQLRQLTHTGRITVRRPVKDGYMIEHIHVCTAFVPDGMVPVNQDGEVERFERIAPSLLARWLRDGAFTLEAGLILVDWLAANQRD